MGKSRWTAPPLRGQNRRFVRDVKKKQGKGHVTFFSLFFLTVVQATGDTIQDFSRKKML